LVAIASLVKEPIPTDFQKEFDGANRADAIARRNQGFFDQ
jgi:hypothetical protein